MPLKFVVAVPVSKQNQLNMVVSYNLIDLRCYVLSILRNGEWHMRGHYNRSAFAGLLKVICQPFVLSLTHTHAVAVAVECAQHNKVPPFVVKGVIGFALVPKIFGKQTLAI